MSATIVNLGNLTTRTGKVVHAPEANGSERHSLCKPCGNMYRARPGMNYDVAYYVSRGSVTCKPCLKAIDAAYAEALAEDVQRLERKADQAEALAMNASVDRATVDAQNDPLVRLLDSTPAPMPMGLEGLNLSPAEVLSAVATLTSVDAPKIEAPSRVSMVLRAGVPERKAYRVSGRLLAKARKTRNRR